MYPRRNRSAQRGNNRQPDKDLSLDIEAENIQNEAGNEASLVANIVAGVSNEANIAAQSNDPMAHYSANDLNRVDDGNDLNRYHANKNGLSHYYEDDLNRLDSRKISKKGMSEKEAPNGQKAEKVLNLIEPLIKEEQDELIRNEEFLPYEGNLKLGVDLGTANIVVSVVDENDTPIAGATYPSTVVRDGIVVDFMGASRAVRNMKAKLEEMMGVEFHEAATAIPPGIISGNVKVISNVVESVGLDVINVVDEPTAAASVLGITDGAVVDVGGGTTGISILKNGEQ